MKRKLLFALLAVFLFCGIATAFAEAQLDYITDGAGLLSQDERLQLESMAETVSREFGIGVYVITLDDYQNYGSGDVFEITYGIYHEYTMGEGEDRDGILLLLSMAERDWAMFCYGDRCEYALNGYGQKELENVFLDHFGAEDWYGGFENYIEECARYMEKAAAGKPVRESPTFAMVIVTGMSLFISLLVVAFIWLRMNGVSGQKNANAYIVGNFNLIEKTDTFSYRTETRRRIESHFSSHRSSRSHSGGGGSGRSGKF